MVSNRHGATRLEKLPCCQYAKLLALLAMTSSLFTLATIARMTRAAMLAALSSGYSRTARTTGLTPVRVLSGYALRSALLPVVTTLGIVFSFMPDANVL